MRVGDCAVTFDVSENPAAGIPELTAVLILRTIDITKPLPVLVRDEGPMAFGSTTLAGDDQHRQEEHGQQASINENPHLLDSRKDDGSDLCYET